MRLLLWFSLLRISWKIPFSSAVLPCAAAPLPQAPRGRCERVTRRSHPIRANHAPMQKCGRREPSNALGRQSACHPKTKRNLPFFKSFLALRRPFAHSFRRSCETEMEQLFQMATMRAARAPDGGSHCGIVTPHGSSPTGMSLMTLSVPVSITLTLLERPLAT